MTRARRQPPTWPPLWRRRPGASPTRRRRSRPCRPPTASLWTPPGRQAVERAVARLAEADKALTDATAALKSAVSPDAFKILWNAQVALEQAAESLDAEPAPRALSPIAYDAKTKRFVLFGGDHLDYMTNDTWVFDPAKQRWEQRHPKTAPPPRANHTLTATGDGKVRLSGGFTHNNTDIWYMGPLYQLRDDGDWVYDVAANTWTSLAGQRGVAPDQREYRTMACFLPQGFIEAGGRPDAAANEAKLKALPPNTWVVMDPPLKPRVNRDWGSACIDPDRDVLLRWSGGHCAHGGSDVPMYHFATNRWELSFPVEFCLGQCYSNTSYPTGFNFNRRPWVSGHTYKCFDYDPVAKLMVFVGHNPWSYLFDPAVADWIGRTRKPGGMSYDSSFYTLTCCQTPAGIYCWTAGGEVFTFDAKTREWQPLKLTGDRLPGSAVDHCGMGYDSKRDRLICFPTAYGQPFTGQAYAVDRKSGAVERLDPSGMARAKAIPALLRELAYLPAADLLVDRRLDAVGGLGRHPSDAGLRLRCQQVGRVDYRRTSAGRQGRTKRQRGGGLRREARADLGNRRGRGDLCPEVGRGQRGQERAMSTLDPRRRWVLTAYREFVTIDCGPTQNLKTCSQSAIFFYRQYCSARIPLLDG